MAWVHLIVAILFEVSGTVSMKLSGGFSRPLPSIAIFVFYSLSIVFLTWAIRQIDISVAYAVWSALGTALVASIGVLWFREPMTVWKGIFLVLIVAGVVGLNLSNGAAAQAE
ncbi:MAG: QacE family quaternary ammonium compound efflux SMR transporter [Deltaproteobacteria bacterium]|nr:MAG: QacE family quaternary ammonium compound efflux SMR transporter [Deltaproteobacteria bacterium]